MHKKTTSKVVSADKKTESAINLLYEKLSNVLGIKVDEVREKEIVIHNSKVTIK